MDGEMVRAIGSRVEELEAAGDTLHMRGRQGGRFAEMVSCSVIDGRQRRRKAVVVKVATGGNDGDGRAGGKCDGG